MHHNITQVFIFAIILLLCTTSSYSFPCSKLQQLQRSTSPRRLFTTTSSDDSYKQNTLKEIAENKKTITATASNGETGFWSCQACGYIYNEAKGSAKHKLKPGTKFAELITFYCPTVRRYLITKCSDG